MKMDKRQKKNGLYRCRLHCNKTLWKYPLYIGPFLVSVYVDGIRKNAALISKQPG